jgi:hypothetical protein
MMREKWKGSTSSQATSCVCSRRLRSIVGLVCEPVDSKASRLNAKCQEWLSLGSRVVVIFLGCIYVATAVLL